MAPDVIFIILLLRLSDSTSTHQNLTSSIHLPSPLCFTPRATIITSTSHFSSLRTNEKNDRLAKIKISSQPTGNLRAIAAHLSTAGKINNNIDSNLLFKCFYNMCFVTAPTLWKISPPCTKILTFLCLHLCLSILLWFWDDILTKKSLHPCPERRNMF